jgi:hypothetical protein
MEPSIYRVSDDVSRLLGIQTMAELDDLLRSLIRIENGRRGVKAHSMELIALLHRDLRESMEILLF